MAQRIIGIVAEFDPFHRGHADLLRYARQTLPGAPVVIAMSGRFTQRGGAACLTPQARGEMALGAGADLVLELPLTCAIASAQRFARGGVETLLAAGMTDLFCGSESARGDLLTACAAALTHPGYSAALRQALSSGIGFAAARQQAVETVAGPETASVLSSPNDLLAVSYLEALGDRPVTLHPFLRQGSAHNEPEAAGGYASASALRSMLLAGQTDQAAAYLPSPAAAVLRRELTAGRGPASLSRCERAVLYRLRQMGPEDFARLPDCSEGLEHRLVRGARGAATLEQFYDLCRSRRCPRSRVQRLALWAFLALEGMPAPGPDYLRVLAMNERGREVLRALSALPVVTAPAGAKKLTGAAAEALRAEERAADLWQLCLPQPGPCGSLWRERPCIQVSSQPRSPRSQSGWD